MFFELVTADVVVADLSIGIRMSTMSLASAMGSARGVCSSSMADGLTPGLSMSRLIVPFGTTASCFRSMPISAKPIEKHPEDIMKAAKGLGAVLTRAIQSDAQGTGSPLYGHLPGLRPVNWDDIEISKARYFGTLQRDWEQRVRTALEKDRPGHIITLAQDAPTRIHRTKILWEAARALIGLCQFHAAEDVLEEILKITPDDIDSQLYLGIVLAICRDTERAEHQLRSMLRRQEAEPKAGAVLGYVYRLLWYLQWKC